MIAGDLNEDMSSLDDSYGRFTRAFSAVIVLDRILNNIEGARPPLLEMPSSIVTADGVKAVRVVFDLKLLDPAHMPHVLIPLLNMQSKLALEALIEVTGGIALLRKILEDTQTESK